MKTFTDFTEADRIWPLERLRAYPLFGEFEPAFAFDPQGPDIVAERGLLQHRTVRELASRVDAMAKVHEGPLSAPAGHHLPPHSQCALFLYQFPDRDEDDCLYAHWAMHADKRLGPGVCVAGASVAPADYPDVAAEVQYWAVYLLTKHPWAGRARGAAESLWRSSKVHWVSAEARALLEAYIDANHGALGAFKALGPLHRHPLTGR